MMWKVVLPVLAALFAVASSSLMGLLVGGVMEGDLNDNHTQAALKFAVTEHNRQSNDMFLAILQNVTRVQKQVVSGMKYIFTVKMGKSPCRKNNSTELCAIHEDPKQAQVHECTFEVWEQLWLSKITLVKNTCFQEKAAADEGEDSQF